MDHRSIRSISFHYEKMNRYSTMQVKEMRGRGRVLPKTRLLYEFPIAFLKGYLVRGYCRYGWWGLVASTNYAVGRYLRLAKSVEAELMERSDKANEGIKTSHKEPA